MIMVTRSFAYDHSHCIAMRLRKPNDISGLIRERREELGWSQTDLAERANVSRQWISLVERGKARVDLDLVFQTLRTLGYELHAELPDRDRPRKMDEVVVHKPGRTTLTAGGAPLGRSGRRGIRGRSQGGRDE